METCLGGPAVYWIGRDLGLGTFTDLLTAMDLIRMLQWLYSSGRIAIQKPIAVGLVGDYADGHDSSFGAQYAHG